MTEESSTIRRSLRDIVLTFVRQTLSGMLQLGLVVIVGFSLGAEGTGLFSVALLLPNILAQFLSLGISSALVYFIASKQFSAQIAWSAGRDAILALAFLGTLFGAVFIMTLGQFVFPGSSPALLFTALGAYPLMLLFNFSLGLLQAQHDFRGLNYAILSQSFFAIVLFTAAAMTDGVDVKIFVALVVLSYIPALLIALIAVSRHVLVFARASEFRSFLRPALTFGMTAHASNVVTYLNYRLDLALVNAIAGTTAAGIYAVAVRIVEQLSVFSTAFVTVIFPKMASMANNEEFRRHYTAFMARSVTWVTFAAALIMALIAKPATTLILGADFAASVSVIYILLPGVVVMSIARILAHDLAARGLVRTNLLVGISGLLINIAGNGVLIPSYGIHGAAAATSASYLIMLLLHIQRQRFIFVNRLGEKASFRRTIVRLMWRHK